jgi:peroxiredoxin
MQQTSSWVKIVVLCGLVLASGSYYRWRDSAAEQPREIVGLDLDGAEMKLSDYRGKVVLLAFWADEPSELRKHLDFLKRLERRNEGEPFVLLGVNSDPSRQAARAAAERLGMTWPSWHDGPEGPIAQSFDVDETPSYILIDHRGEISAEFDTLLPENMVEPMIDQLVHEAKRASKRR